MSSDNPLQRITITLSPRAKSFYNSPDGTLTFDVPVETIQRLAEHGLRTMATDSVTIATLRGGDPLDILWERLDALSKNV